MMILFIGIVVTASSWAVAWGRIAGVNEFSFFLLWIGYILLINGASEGL